AAQANIAVFPEALRQCDPIGMNASEGDAIAEHPGFCRWPTGKKRRARWIAKRKLAVISVKTNTGFGEGVEVRRLGVKHTAVTAWIPDMSLAENENPVELGRAAPFFCGEQNKKTPPPRRSHGGLPKKFATCDATHFSGRILAPWPRYWWDKVGNAPDPNRGE